MREIKSRTAFNKFICAQKLCNNRTCFKKGSKGRELRPKYFCENCRIMYEHYELLKEKERAELYADLFNELKDKLKEVESFKMLRYRRYCWTYKSSKTIKGDNKL